MRKQTKRRITIQKANGDRIKRNFTRKQLATRLRQAFGPEYTPQLLKNVWEKHWNKIVIKENISAKWKTYP